MKMTDSYMKKVATISRTYSGGWDYEVQDENGEEISAGTAPSIVEILSMVEECLYEQYGD